MHRRTIKRYLCINYFKTYRKKQKNSLTKKMESKKLAWAKKICFKTNGVLAESFIFRRNLHKYIQWPTNLCKKTKKLILKRQMYQLGPKTPNRNEAIRVFQFWWYRQNSWHWWHHEDWWLHQCSGGKRCCFQQICFSKRIILSLKTTLLRAAGQKKLKNGMG